MESLKDYLKGIQFDYAISYSGLRGQALKTYEQDYAVRIQKKEATSYSARFMERSRLQKEIEILRQVTSLVNARLLNKKGELHPSAIAVHRFERNNIDTDRILNILNIKYEDHSAWMCAPIFRDAIVFYSKDDHVVGILHVCFSCESIKNEKEENMAADGKIFRFLKEELIRLGHNIGEDI